MASRNRVATQESIHPAAGKASRDARAQLSAQTRPLRAELQQIDGRLARLSQEKAQVEAKLVNPTAGDYAELGRNLAHISAEISMLEERWLELQTQLEAMNG